MLLIGRQFNGPPGSAHGGVACGVFATAIDSRAATVRLLKPPPLGVEFTVQDGDDGLTIIGPESAVALVRSAPRELSVDPLPWLADADVRAAEQHWAENTIPSHPFPDCFGCGHARPSRDGLQLFAGDVPDSDLCAAYWTPHSTLVGTDGAIPDWVAWAALDCPSGSATFRHVGEGWSVLLGEFVVHIDEAPVAGERYQVVARSGPIEGRKLRNEVGIVAADGHNLARGRATWITIPVAA